MSAPHLNLVLLAVEPGGRKTPVIAKLEGHGFRILCERGQVTILSSIRDKVEVLAPRRRLGDPEIWDRLEPSWHRMMHWPSSTSADLVSVPAPVLLTPERFDIAIKCLYGRLWMQKRAPGWRDTAYLEQVLRITGAGETIQEYDGSGKWGFGQYMSAYHSLLQDLEPGGLPVVPADESWIAFDGAHRIAAAIVMDRRVHVARIDAPSPCVADAPFFAGASHGHPPCSEEILDEAAIEYCRVKKGLALALIFPVVPSETYAIDRLRGVGRIVYQKDVVLSPDAGRALLRQVYLGHPWLQGEGESAGFASKVEGCFPFRGVARAVLIDDCDMRALRSEKERIRSHYRLGNHSIHITDGDEEVLRVARVMFNGNSVALLRAGIGEYPGFHRRIFAYRGWLERRAVDEEAFCVDAGAVLALLGLRECRDIDFLYHGDTDSMPAPPDGIDCHNDLERYHRHTIANLVGDPRLHCWYMGIKFCAPHVVAEMKRCRGETKDLADIALLASRLPRLQDRQRPLDQLIVKMTSLRNHARAWRARILRPLRLAVRALRVGQLTRDESPSLAPYLSATEGTTQIGVETEPTSPEKESETAGNEWDEYRMVIAREFRQRPMSFLRQPVISRTLHPNQQRLARKYLTELSQQRFARVSILPRLCEIPTGDPWLCSFFPLASPLTMQHAYYIFMMKKHFDIFGPQGDLHYILELGGGYGNFCRLMHGFGYSGRYVIADLSELHVIQRHFLRSALASSVESGIEFRSMKDFDHMLPKSGPSLLIATFSLSEMPLLTRRKVEKYYCFFDYLFIAYNRAFGSVDNLAYFEDLKSKLDRDFDACIIKDRYRAAWFLLGQRHSTAAK